MRNWDGQGCLRAFVGQIRNADDGMHRGHARLSVQRPPEPARELGK